MANGECTSDRQRPPPIRYGCICSGISAPTLAAKPLGWETAFFSEIEPFPRAVLAHHYPTIPLHGDFTTIERTTYGTVDLLVGGTPCQSFSVAGKRLGLDDPRGNLALEYVRLAERLDAKWLVFENVPGLLSSAKGDDFAAFISAVTGHDYRTPAKGWRNAGIAEGKPGRWGLAWRVLDAQYFGVAQRRRRVFVVGYRGDWRPAAAVLLEPEGLRGNPPPSREKGKAVAALTATGVGTCGADDNQGQAGHLIAAEVAPTLRAGGNTTGGHRPPGTDVDTMESLLAFGGNNTRGPIDVATACNAHGGASGRLDFESETFIAHTLRGEGFDASEDGTGRGTPLIPVHIAEIAGPLTSGGTGQRGVQMSSENAADGRLIAFPANMSATQRGFATDRSASLRTGGEMAICYPILEPGARTGTSTNDPRVGIGIGYPEDPMFTLQAGKQHGLAVSLRGRDGGATAELSGDVMPALRASQGGGDKPHILMPSMVRRLTPEECELLQGAPKGFTRISWRGKSAEECPDGPRYKAIGNSMAVPCMQWILERLDTANAILGRNGTNA